MKLSKAHDLLNTLSFNGKYFEQKGEEFRATLDKLAKIFYNIKSVRGVQKEFKELEDDNFHAENSLLLAVAYGTPKQVEKMKNLLVNERTNKTTYKERDKNYKARREFAEVFENKHDKRLERLWKASAIR